MEGPNDSVNLPKFGWSVKFDHVFSQDRRQITRATWRQALSMLRLGIRYIIYYLWLFFHRKKPVMDFIFPSKNCGKRGVPLGGIGCGSIGRSYLGDFGNFQMQPGEYVDGFVPANQFIVTIIQLGSQNIYQKVLCVKDKPPNVLSGWDWSFPADSGQYVGLYPRAWSVFSIPEYKVNLVCRQVSPVIPHNYKDSSIPGAVFVWDVINLSGSILKVSITFTFRDGVGEDSKGLVSSEFFENSSSEGKSSLRGVSMRQTFGGVPCTYSISASQSNESDVTATTYFDPTGDGCDLWSHLKEEGKLDETPPPMKTHKNLACAVCSQVTLFPNESRSSTFVLVWDMPMVRFPAKGTVRKRFYTKYFGIEGFAGPDMSLYCLENLARWETEIEAWQEPVLNDETLPDWYKSALFNELYYVSDGGTVWLLPFEGEEFPTSDPRHEYGHFAYLEGHEYRMYNTYDVHFYASFALSILWPGLQSSIQFDIRDSIDREDLSTMWYLYDGRETSRKKKGCVPHDIGDPTEEPFDTINSYPLHDVSEWKDLNLKYVLQVYRDYHLHSDLDQVRALFPQVLTVMERSLLWDTDGDGLIENTGFPDQTYDCWVMTGPSAYCGSLWLAALYATVSLARDLSLPDVAAQYSLVLEKAKVAFKDKLWNGKYYNFDCSQSEAKSDIMSDQLCGVWYLRCCGVTDEVLPHDDVASAVRVIYDNNVLKYYNGEQGAVNGMSTLGTVSQQSVQSAEMWTGVAYSVCALLISQGLTEEGFHTAHGVYHTVYNKSALSYATPEALSELDSFRSLSYMRPLSIWSIQLVLNNQKVKS